MPDYFDDMLARVREIFALAADYAPSLPQTHQFFSIIQNKLHFAVTGITAAKIIVSLVNHAVANAGLLSWARDGVQKTDVTIAKNYLKADEITGLNRIVTMWLDFSEDQATRRKQVFMRDWEQKLDDFLRFNEREVLPHAGKISKKQADTKTHAAYKLFAAQRRAQKEIVGENDQFSQLAAAAKHIADTKPKGKK